MNAPESEKQIQQLAGKEPKSWLEKNVAHPAYEAIITGLYEPTASLINLVPHALTGNDWLPKVKVDSTHDEAPADGGEYLTRLLVHGSIGALSYTAYGRVTGGLLRKGRSLAKLEGRAATFVGSECTGQIAGAAVHDALLDAPDLRSRTANIASGITSFGTFEFFNRSIANKHWITRAIAHAPIGFAGGMTGYLTREGVAGRAIEGNAAMQASIDGAALNFFLPAMQWTSGKLIDTVKDKTGGSIPLERHANYEKLKGKSQTLDTLMRLFPATRVSRSAEEGACIDHNSDTVHVMPKSPADHLAHELAHKLAFKKFEGDIQYAAKLLKYNEEIAKEKYIATRLKQEDFARQTQLKVAKEILLSQNPHAKVPRPEHSHMLPIYRRHFEMEFDNHFQPSKGKWRPEEDFANLTIDQRQSLKDSADISHVVKTLHPELTNFEQTTLVNAVKGFITWNDLNYAQQMHDGSAHSFGPLKAFDVLDGMPRKAFSTALKWSIIERAVGSWKLDSEQANNTFAFDEHPQLALLKKEISQNIADYRQKLQSAELKQKQSTQKAQLDFVRATLDLVENYDKQVLLHKKDFNRRNVELSMIHDRAINEATKNNDFEGVRLAERQEERDQAQNFKQLQQALDPIKYRLDKEVEPARRAERQSKQEADRLYEQEKQRINKNLCNQIVRAIDRLNIRDEEFFSLVPDAWNPQSIPISPKNVLSTALTFGKNVDHWWRSWGDFNTSPMNIPVAPLANLQGLAVFYAHNKLAPSHILKPIAEFWPRLSEAEKDSLLTRKISDNVHTIAKYRFPKAKRPELAAELCRWKRFEYMDESTYKICENRFLAEHSVPDAFPTNTSWTDGNLKGYFLKRTDPRILTLGEYTNCCLHLEGINEGGLWWALGSKNAGFFVVEDARSGQIIAASRAWHTPEKGVCFNNVEAKGLENKHEQALNIYKQAARHLVANQGVKGVNVGIISGELNIDSLPMSDQPMSLPDDIQGDSNCRFEQKVLAESN